MSLGQPRHSRQLPPIVDAERRARSHGQDAQLGMDWPGRVRARAVVARADGSARRYGVRFARTEYTLAGSPCVVEKNAVRSPSLLIGSSPM